MRRQQAGGPDWGERVSLCAQTAEAVADVHAAGVAHNDVKVHLYSLICYLGSREPITAPHQFRSPQSSPSSPALKGKRREESRTTN